MKSKTKNSSLKILIIEAYFELENNTILYISNYLSLNYTFVALTISEYLEHKTITVKSKL